MRLELKQKVQNFREFQTIQKEVNAEQFKANMKMFERFEEDDDVQNVYHNMEITEELMNSL